MPHEKAKAAVWAMLLLWIFVWGMAAFLSLGGWADLRKWYRKKMRDWFEF